MLLYKPVVLAQKKKNLPMLYFKHLHNKGVNMAKSLVSKNKQGDTKIIHALDRRVSCYADIVINYFR